MNNVHTHIKKLQALYVKELETDLYFWIFIRRERTLELCRLLSPRHSAKLSSWILNTKIFGEYGIFRTSQIQIFIFFQKSEVLQLEPVYAGRIDADARHTVINLKWLCRDQRKIQNRLQVTSISIALERLHITYIRASNPCVPLLLLPHACMHSLLSRINQITSIKV